MITGVTGVTRGGGIDLPTPALRTTVPPPTPSRGDAEASSSGSTGSTGATGSTGSTGGTARPAPAEHHDARSDRDADEGGSAATATSRYLAELLTARVLGGAAPSGRPAQITPERLASLISYLEAGVSSSTSAKESSTTSAGAAGAASKGVDVTS